MSRSTLAIVVATAAFVLAATAVVLVLTDDDEVGLQRVVVVATSENDPTADKWVQVSCPRGYTVIGGGGNIPHGNDTPGVALYWSSPYQNDGWEVAAQDTRRRDHPWTLTVQAICARPVRGDPNVSGGLPPQTFEP